MGYTDSFLTVRLGHAVVVSSLAVITAGCATTGAVPRPFPGAKPVPARPAPEPPTPIAATPAAVPAGTEAPVPVAAAPTTAGPAPTEPASLAALALASALQFQGVRYKSGGSDPSGFDCSGLVQYVFARQGIAMPREVRGQFEVGYQIETDELRPGDLLFFNTEADGASHVGIAIDATAFVHAPNSRGVVRVERLSTTYWSRRFLGARRIE